MDCKTSLSLGLSMEQKRRNIILLQRTFVIAMTCLAGAFWLIWRGPQPVIQGTKLLKDITPFWYMFSAFPILGILVADGASLLQKAQADRGSKRFTKSLYALELGIHIILLVLLSSIRLKFQWGISGHALLLGYFLLRKSLFQQPNHPWQKVELMVGWLIFGVIVYTKVFIWQDSSSLAQGTLLGVVIALSPLVYRKMKTHETSPDKNECV